jgi:CubicO group peptidase (beta-lactamase class C family)
MATAAFMLPAAGIATAAAADFARLQRQIEQIRVEHRVPGAALIVVDQDRIVWSAGLGVADKDSAEPVTPDTVFRIGSISKIFTAAALVQLSRQDDFDLTDELTMHMAPGLYFNRWLPERPITVAHLLEHTSGFRDWNKAEFDHNDPAPASLEDGLAFSPESRTTHWEPGLHSVYSNANYGLAGLVLEHVAKQSYEDVVHNKLFLPLEMHSATSLPARTSGLATGYSQNGFSPIRYWNMIQRPAAAINTTPREMAALVSMLLAYGDYKGDTVLFASEVERIEMPTTSLAARNGLQFGYGLGIYRYHRNGFVFFGHGGDGDGYLSRFAYSRDLGLGYFVTINSAHHRALNKMYKAIENEITRGHVAPEAPAPVVLDNRSLRHFSGHYELAAWRFAWQSPNRIAQRSIDVRPDENGNLRIEYSDGDYAMLIPVNQNEFRRVDEREATSGFFEEDGRLYFQEDDNWVKVTELIDTELDHLDINDTGLKDAGLKDTGRNNVDLINVEPGEVAVPQ